MGPHSLKKLFTFKKEILNHSLHGSSSLIRLSKPNTNNTKKSFMYDGAPIWNSLPENIRESNSIASLCICNNTTLVNRQLLKIWFIPA